MAAPRSQSFGGQGPAQSARPLAIDLFCGLGGWADGLLAEGWEVIGFDIERHVYGAHRYPGLLVIQDVLTVHGSQFKDAALIVASPPCQDYSYMAMPWQRAKARAAEYRSGKRDVKQLTALFDACFRIQREACAAAGRHVPLVVENVRGAIPWVGRSRWNFGSFHLWGDVPALMPPAQRFMKVGDAGWREIGPGRQLQDRAIKNNGGSWFNIGSPGQKVVGQNLDGRKTAAHPNIRDGHPHTRHLTNPAEHGIKQRGSGREWFAGDGKISRMTSSKSPARKMASAMIAKIPLTLSRHIAATFYPVRGAA